MPTRWAISDSVSPFLTLYLAAATAVFFDGTRAFLVDGGDAFKGVGFSAGGRAGGYVKE